MGEGIPDDIFLPDNLPNVAVENTFQWQQQRNMNSAMYSFLALSVSGEATTMVRGGGAGEMNGLEAWRNLVRYIEHGRPIRLETISREMEIAHQRPINDLTKVVIGIAEYELKYHEYLEVGGKPLDDYDLKQNLTNIPQHNYTSNSHLD